MFYTQLLHVRRYHKRKKKIDNLTIIFATLESANVKAACKMLMKLRPEFIISFVNKKFNVPLLFQHQSKSYFFWLNIIQVTNPITFSILHIFHGHIWSSHLKGQFILHRNVTFDINYVLQGKLNKGSVGWRMSTHFSYLKLAVGIIK